MRRRFCLETHVRLIMAQRWRPPQHNTQRILLVYQQRDW